MANDTTTKVTDLNEAEQVAENDVFLLTHSNGLSEKVTAETLFKNGSKTIVLTRAEYDALGGDYKQDAIYAISDESTGGINVDQTYDPEGVNPLSGQAVNGALANCVNFNVTTGTGRVVISSQKCYAENNHIHIEVLLDVNTSIPDGGSVDIIDIPIQYKTFDNTIIGSFMLNGGIYPATVKGKSINGAFGVYQTATNSISSGAVIGYVLDYNLAG